MENKPTDLWSSYKELNQFVEACISKPIDGVATGLSKALVKYKHNFLHVMKNAPKNARSRKVVEARASGNGATLPQEIVDEAITLSNMYNLDEQVALDLLCTAQQRCADYPGIPRGPVAILLYYDAHLALATTLKMLVQAHQGLRWKTNCSANVQKTVNKFVDDLVLDGLLEAIFAALSSMKLAKEISLLQQNRGLGGAYHHHLVTTLYTGIQGTLADIVLMYSSQCGLGCQPLLALLNHLRTTAPEHDARGGMDSVTIALLIALLYAIDVSIVQEKDHIENIQSFLPLLSEDNLISRFNTELCNPQSNWTCNGIRIIAQFAWGLTLASIRSFTSNVRSVENLPEDEDSLVNQCIQDNVFHFLNNSLLSVEGVFKQELCLRKLHSLITEFIVLMPIHVRELRARADKECMKIQAHLNEGIQPPNDLAKHFEEFLRTISLLYSEDPLNLKLHQEYWCLQDSGSLFKTRIPPKQICLLKFIKQCGESLPPQLFIPYLKMITALTASPEVARETFSMLKNFRQYFCWDHFFDSLRHYLTHLRQDQNPTTDTIYHRHHHKGIAPLEVQGLQAVLGLIRTVAGHDELSRQKMCEHTPWNAIQVILSLLSCSVNIELKAELVLTLAAFAKSPSIAAALWHQIEASQIIPTVQTTSYFQSRGVLSELEEVESRNEEYPLTRAILTLLAELTNTPVPFTLGSGMRTPGLDPYIHYILKNVLLTFANRAYKDPSEKWEVARSCVSLLVKFTFDYEPRFEDFTGGGPNVEGGGAKVNPHPGYHIMLNMCSQSQLLRTIFFIIDETCLQLDTYSPFPGKTSLEAASLECLRLVSCVLDLQKTFLSFDSQCHTSYMLTGLHKLLFGMNIRSNQPDHAVNIAKFITYNSWLPQHAHYCSKILRLLTSYVTAQNDLRSSIIISTALRQSILHGFVKCLEVDDDDEAASLASKTKVFILKLMLQCLNYSAPNFTHYLCGFNTSNVSKTVLQHAGVLGSPRTCLHSIISLLGESLRSRSPESTSLSAPSSLVLRLCYQLLYALGAHTITSAPILRYLRSANDVLHLHLTNLPFLSSNSTCNTEDYYQMSWLLKLVAIELQVTAHQSQLSQLSRLVDVLTGAGVDQGQNVRNSILDSQNPPSAPRLILRLLSLIDLSLRPIEKPSWENFEDDRIMEILETAEFVAEHHLKKINVKRVRRILMNELAMVTEWPTLTQKQRVLAETEAVVDFAIRYNTEKQAGHAVWSYFQAWKEVAGILFGSTPQDMIPFQTRFDMLVQIIEALLGKVEVDMLRSDLASICSESLLLMMSNMRSSFTQERNNRENLALSQLMSPREVTILPSIVNWILNSGATSQQMRANFNASLLTFLHMAREDGLSLRQLALGSDAKEEFAFHEDLSVLASLETTVSVTSPFNNLIDDLPVALVETLCIDFTGGYDINKMLALANLSAMIQVNHKWVLHLSITSFFRVLIDSLLMSDRSLVDVLISQQDSLRPLFVFEAKMAFLTRVALTKQGAQMLLEHNIMQCLSDMRVFDQHPDLPYFSTVEQYEISPSNMRFQQVIIPTLKFLKSILITLGTENRRCGTSKVMRFLLDHMESLTIVLRYASPQLPLGLLQELSGVTYILAATYSQTESEISREFIRLRNLMTVLAYRFQINSKSIANIKSSHPDTDALDVIHCVLDIQCHALLFLKNLTAFSGIDKRLINIILEPSLLTLTNTEVGDRGDQSSSADLGVIVKQMIDAVAYYHHEIPSLALLSNKLTSVQDMNQATLTELVSNSNISVNIDETRRLARIEMQKQISMKKAELSKLRYIIETCLYLLWSHLDYFMLLGVPETLISRNKTQPERSFSQSLSESAWDATVDRLQKLREDLAIVLNETFSVQLVKTAEGSEKDSNYVEALLRRVKKLIQFAPTDVILDTVRDL